MKQLQDIKAKVESGEITKHEAYTALMLLEGIDNKAKIQFANELNRIKPLPTASMEFQDEGKYGPQVRLQADHEKAKQVYLSPKHFIQYYRAFHSQKAEALLEQCQELEQQTAAK